MARFARLAPDRPVLVLGLAVLCVAGVIIRRYVSSGGR